MGQEALNGILQALTAAHMRGVERARINVEAKRNQQQSEEAQARIKIEQQRADQEHEHQQALMEAARAQAKLNHVRTLQEIAAGIKQGVPVPGEQVNDIPGTGGAAQVHTINDETGKPIASVMLPSREEMLKQQANEEEVLQKPKTAARLQEIRATKEADEAKAEMQKGEDERRAKIIRQSDELIARGHDAAMLEHARIMAGAKNQPTLDPEGIKPYVEGGISGQYTLDELKKSLPNKADFQMAMSGITATGSVPFTTKQKQIKQDFESAAQLIPQFQTIQDLMTKPVQTIDPSTGKVFTTDPRMARIPMTQTNNLIRKNRDQIKEKLINSLTAFGQGGRLSDPRVKALTEAFSPSLMPNTSLANGEAAQNFKSYLADTVDAHLSSLAKPQRDKIKLDLGLAGVKSGMPAQVAPGVTHTYDPINGLQVVSQQ